LLDKKYGYYQYLGWNILGHRDKRLMGNRVKLHPLILMILINKIKPRFRSIRSNRSTMKIVNVDYLQYIMI